MRIRHVALLLFAVALAVVAGCAPAPSQSTAEATDTAQAVVAEVSLPAIIEVRAAIEAVAPTPAKPVCSVSAEAVALIVRYEVTSPSYYTARLQMPIWPGAQSGVTWGVGYDGGHQTRSRILGDWSAHTHAERLAETAGVIGPHAKALLPALADIRTPYAYAADVFAAATLPSYCELTARTYRDGWAALPEHAQGALVATVYNRGAGMQGDRRREMRTMRDVCVPAGDVECIARELRSMPRLWVGTPVESGLRARYEATALLAERRA